MTFSEQLRPHVDRLGATKCAALCGIARQTINFWLRGAGTPKPLTQNAVLAILKRAKSAPVEATAPATATAAEIPRETTPEVPYHG
jgi:hypothetical protein